MVAADRGAGTGQFKEGGVSYHSGFEGGWGVVRDVIDCPMVKACLWGHIKGFSGNGGPKLELIGIQYGFAMDTQGLLKRAWIR
jgi:hypothetical protein